MGVSDLKRREQKHINKVHLCTVNDLGYPVK